MTRTNEKGEFVVHIWNQTPEQTQQDLADSGIVTFGGSSGKPFPDQQAIYTAKKYLYTGQSNVDLYRCEIPYTQAESAPAVKEKKETPRQ